MKKSLFASLKNSVGPHFGLVVFVATLSIGVVIYGAWFVLAIIQGQQVRDYNIGETCFVHNVRELATGIKTYRETHGEFPTDYVDSITGRPILSWRVKLLPLLGEEELYSLFQLDEPWNSPINRRLIDQMPRIYRGPIGDGKWPTGGGLTVLQLLRGKREVFPTGKAANQAIVLVESNRPTLWTKPYDINLQSVGLPVRVGANNWNEPGGFVGLYDGTAKFRTAIQRTDKIIVIPFK